MVAWVTVVMEVLGVLGGITKAAGQVGISVVGTVGLSVGTKSFSVGTVSFSVGTVSFSVGRVSFSVGTVSFSVGTVSFSAGTVSFPLDIRNFLVGTVGFPVRTVVFFAERRISEGPVGGTGDLEGGIVGTGPAKKKKPWSLVKIIPPPSSLTSNWNG